MFILFPAEMASKSMWSSDDYIEHSPLFPNPVKCIVDMAVTGVDELYLRFPWNGIGAWLTETKEWIVASAYIDVGVIFFPILFAVLFTILREVLNRALFKVIEKEPCIYKLVITVCGIDPMPCCMPSSS